MYMAKWNLVVLSVVGLILSITAYGCVERKLTINTEPQEALVSLNDEEIGESPVTVSFNWYGNYSVRISKEGYETLNTHRELKAPQHDSFPFDIFANVFGPNRIVDSYQWTFKLTEKKQPDRELLIRNAQKLEKQL